MTIKNKKNKIVFYLINLLVVLIVSILTIVNILEENGVQALTNIKELTAGAIVILTFLFFINYYLEGLIITISIKEYNKDYKPQYGFIAQCVGGLFSAITPMKIGYFPGLGYANSKFNVKTTDLIKSMEKTGFASQVLALILSFISIIIFTIYPVNVRITGGVLELKNIAIIGLVYNMILMIGYFVLVLSPTIHNFVIKIISWILKKIGKINNQNLYIEEKQEKMAITRMVIKKYLLSFKESVIIFCLYILKTIVSGCRPYVVYLLLTGESFQIGLFFYTIILGNLITYITNIIPIPGGSGAAEVSFMAVFSIVFAPDSLLTSVMLVWRLFSYFINIIVGFIVFIIMINIKRKGEIQDSPIQ